MELVSKEGCMMPDYSKMRAYAEWKRKRDALRIFLCALEERDRRRTER
jgi:hypothetical protein